jgi:hypothetical protein
MVISPITWYGEPVNCHAPYTSPPGIIVCENVLNEMQKNIRKGAKRVAKFFMETSCFV